MLIAFITAALAAEIREPGADIDFFYAYPAFDLSGTRTFVIDAVEDDTVAPQCSRGWARAFCLSGTYSTTDGSVGTFEAWAERPSGTAVFQVVRMVDQDIGTIFTGEALTSSDEPFSGDIQAVWPDPDVFGIWQQIGTVQGVLLPAAERAKNAGRRPARP